MHLMLDSLKLFGESIDREKGYHNQSQQYHDPSR